MAIVGVNGPSDWVSRDTVNSDRTFSRVECEHFAVVGTISRIIGDVSNACLCVYVTHPEIGCLTRITFRWLVGCIQARIVTRSLVLLHRLGRFVNVSFNNAVAAS